MTIAQEHPFSLSPAHSSPEDPSMLYEDDSKDLFDFDEKPKKSNGRKGNGPGAADKRATHNAIERARRESLNGRFMTLAEALPAMANVKRPSKSIIVNKALDFVYEAQVKEHALIKENNELRRQLDQLRARLGMGPLPPPAPLPGSTPSPKSVASETVSPATVAMDKVSPASMFGSAADDLMAAYTSSPASAQAEPSPVASVSSTESAPTSFATLPVASQAPTLHPAYAGPPMTAFGMQSGFMNPSLLSQQHTLLLAAHLQQQQQMQQQHHQQQQELQFLSTPWASMGMHQMPAATAPQGYNPLEPYAAFMA